MNKLQKIILIGFPFLFVSCNTGNDKNVVPAFNIEDSTAIVQVILDSMHNEIVYWPGERYSMCCPSSPGPRLRIHINALGEVMIQNDYESPSISEKVYQFYLANLIENDLSNRYPLYSHLYRGEVKSQMLQMEQELLELKEKFDYLPDYIDFKGIMLNEIRDQYNLLKALNINKVRIPQYASTVDLQCNEQSGLCDQYLDSVLLGFYNIREEDSKIYFKESYAKIFWKAIELKDSTAITQLKLFKLLHPITFWNGYESPQPTLVEVN